MKNVATGSWRKQPIDPDQVRTRPRQFAMLNRWLVHGKHISFMSPEQIALYTFLECVSGPEGISWYSDDRVCEVLNFSLNGLWYARSHLVDAGLLLYRKPIYQLLNLPRLDV